MKKLLICILFVLLVTPIFSEGAKVSEMKTVPDAYFFSGFNFKKYNPDSPESLTDIVEDEIEYIADKQNKTPKKYAIVGHSQGGLRVLAYTSMIEELGQTDPKYKNAADNLSAVVTVSGIDQGLKALNGGFKAVNKKLDDDISILYDGMWATLWSNPITMELSSYLCVVDALLVGFGFTDVDFITEAGIKAFLLNMMGEEYSSYIKPALNGEGEDSMPEIRDMIPQSDFIEKNVSETIASQVKVRDKSKDKKTLEIAYKKKKILGVTVKIPYITTKTVPGYSYKTVYSSVPRVSNDIPFLYVVGLDSNTLKLVEQQVNNDKFTEKKVRELAETMENIMEIGKVSNIVYNCCITGLLTGGIKRVEECNKAKKWFADIDAQIDDLLGSSKHDGLVAKESQFYPREWHTNLIDPKGYGYVPEDNENHDSINPTKNTRVAKEINDLLDEKLHQ